MEEEVFPLGSRVCVVNDSTFRGRIGIILAIHMNATPGGPTKCFYLVALDGAYQQESHWFESQEAALIGATCEKHAEC